MTTEALHSPVQAFV